MIRWIKKYIEKTDNEIVRCKVCRVEGKAKDMEFVTFFSRGDYWLCKMHYISSGIKKRDDTLARVAPFALTLILALVLYAIFRR